VPSVLFFVFLEAPGEAEDTGEEDSGAEGDLLHQPQLHQKPGKKGGVPVRCGGATSARFGGSI
jgi:hypothetical protein